MSLARRAKDLCAAAARAAKEAEQAATESLHQPSQPGSLSIEAVEKLGNAQPPVTGSVTGAPSFMAREGRKTSTVGGSKGVAGKNVPQVQQASPPETPPYAAPIARKLSVSASVCGEDGLYSCVLPEDLLVELLSERMLVRIDKSDYDNYGLDEEDNDMIMIMLMALDILSNDYDDNDDIN